MVGKWERAAAPNFNMAGHQLDCPNPQHALPGFEKITGTALAEMQGPGQTKSLGDEDCDSGSYDRTDWDSRKRKMDWL
jgi:hypothetical protein